MAHKSFPILADLIPNTESSIVEVTTLSFNILTNAGTSECIMLVIIVADILPYKRS